MKLTVITLPLFWLLTSERHFHTKRQNSWHLHSWVFSVVSWDPCLLDFKEVSLVCIKSHRRWHTSLTDLHTFIQLYSRCSLQFFRFRQRLENIMHHGFHRKMLWINCLTTQLGPPENLTTTGITSITGKQKYVNNIVTNDSGTLLLLRLFSRLTVISIFLLCLQETSIFGNLMVFCIANMLLVSLASTLPVPLGLIMPSFKIGAGMGRLVGEGLAFYFPRGINPSFDRTQFPIIPGAYAVAGAAAFAGSTTGALSSAVIILEMTGQLTHLIPIIVCVLISVSVSRSLGDSLYDTWISLKKLPYLPYVLRSNPGVSDLVVEDFMRRDLIFVWEGCSYKNIKHILDSAKSLQNIPYVKNIENQIFLGTIDREELQSLLEKKLRRRPKQLSSRPFAPKLDSIDTFIDDSSSSYPVKKSLVDTMKVWRQNSMTRLQNITVLLFTLTFIFCHILFLTLSAKTTIDNTESSSMGRTAVESRGWFILLQDW